MSTSPASCTSRWAASARRGSASPSGRSWTSGSGSWSGRSTRVDERRPRPSSWPTARSSPTTSSSSRPARGSCPRRSSTSTRRPTTSTPPRPRAASGTRSTLHRRADRHRHRLDAVQVPARPARGRLPHRGRAPRARPARAERDALLLADRARVHDRIRQRDGDADPRPRRGSSSTRSSTSRRSIADRKVVQSLEGEELPYDLLILVPPHKGQQFLIDSGLAPAPGGWLPTDRHTLRVGNRPNVYALGDATDLPLSKAGSTAHFEAPVVTEQIAAAIEGREPEGQARLVRRQRHVLLRGRRRQGDAPPVRLRPPAEASEAECVLAPRQDRLQQDLLPHGAERPHLRLAYAACSRLAAPRDPSPGALHYPARCTARRCPAR